MTSETIKIFCVNNGSCIEVEKGSSILEIFNKSGVTLGSRVMGALVNNRTQSLNFKVYKPKDIEFFDYSSPHGERVYIHTLCLNKGRSYLLRTAPNYYFIILKLLVV